MCFLQALLERVSVSDRAARSIWRNSFPFLSYRYKKVDFAPRISSYKSTINLSSRSNCCLQCHLSRISSSAASSKSLRSTCRKFWHAMSLHWPHAGVHWRSFLKQVQERVSHLPLQLYLMFRSSCLGAASCDICTGTRPVEYLAHPHSSGERSFPFHTCICRKTQWQWNRAAPEVGSSFSGGTYSAEVATFV